MDKTKIGVVIVAGGSGKRLGFDMPKALIEIRTQPMFLYSLCAIQMCEDFIDHVVLVTPRGWKKRFVDAIKNSSIMETEKIATGGKERQDSVRAGLKKLPSDTEIVLIHDAARPFITPYQIQKITELVQEYGAASAAVAVRDTLRKSALGKNTRFLSKEVDRNELWALGTPQGFKYREILEAHEKAYQHGIIHNDDTALLSKSKKIAIYETDFLNFKITWRSDLELADSMVEIWRKRISLDKKKIPRSMMR